MGLCAKKSTLWIPFSGQKDAQENERLIQQERSLIEQQSDLHRQLFELLRTHQLEAKEK